MPASNSAQNKVVSKLRPTRWDLIDLSTGWPNSVPTSYMLSKSVGLKASKKRPSNVTGVIARPGLLTTLAPLHPPNH